MAKNSVGRKFIHDLIEEVDYDIYRERDVDEKFKSEIAYINELHQDSRLLEALRGAGVDNWEGWDIALEMLDETE